MKHGEASDQSGAPPSPAEPAQNAGADQSLDDPLQRRSSDPGTSLTSVEVAPASGVNETKGSTTLTIRTVPHTDQSHPLASKFSRLQESPLAGQSPAGASRSYPAASPLRSRDSQESFAGQVLAHARSIGAKVHHDAVSFAAIARNPSLARLARRELDDHQHNTAIEKVDTDGPVASTAFYAHDAEVERQWAALEAVNADTKEESTLNKELMYLICARLEASRRSSERLLGVLQALAASETAYAHAMTVTSSIPLPGECDGDTMKAALNAFSSLPQVVGEAHRDALLSMSGLNRALHALVTEMRRVCEEVRGSSQRCLRGVEHGSSQLQQSFINHQQACRQFDLALLDRRRGRSARPLEQDPWLTESGMVQAHHALRHAQEEERRLLTSSHQQLQDLEARRVDLIKKVVTAFLTSYRLQLSAAKETAEGLRAMTGDMVSSSDLADLTRSAEAVEERSKELASKQAETLEQVAEELLCSPEIIRQGDMARWLPVSNMWQDCHFVLTRAGFLHWFHDMEHVRPLDCLNLACCQFEAGEAPTFNLVENHTGKLWFFSSWLRTVAFKAPDVDECCEWAIALREAIATAHGDDVRTH
ncbi:hypothetical protein ABBQ32_007413 [Trebouxia sp. C0010 RCD-2024]